MKNLLKALAIFQAQVPIIHKGTQGYGYSYADLPAIFEIITPILTDCGLVFTQGVEGTTLTTTVYHVDSGESITNSMDIPQGVALKGMNEFQVLGSAITYLRRYQLSCMLGLVTDKDTDAAGKKDVPQQKQQPDKKLQKVWVNPDDENWNNLVKFAQQKNWGIDDALGALKKKGWSISKDSSEKLKNLLETGEVA